MVKTNRCGVGSRHNNYLGFACRKGKLNSTLVIVIIYCAVLECNRAVTIVGEVKLNVIGNTINLRNTTVVACLAVCILILIIK